MYEYIKNNLLLINVNNGRKKMELERRLLAYSYINNS